MKHSYSLASYQQQSTTAAGTIAVACVAVFVDEMALTLARGHADTGLVLYSFEVAGASML
jgi:hypothetical protein